MKRKVVEKIGQVAFVAIPAGLISWMFWSDGWKVAVIGVVVFVMVTIQIAALNNVEKQDKK